MMRRTFGWDLPPGVTDRMIDEAAGGFDEPREEDIYMARDTTDRQILAEITNLHRDLVVMHDTLGSILLVAERLVGIDIRLRRLEEAASTNPLTIFTACGESGSP